MNDRIRLDPDTLRHDGAQLAELGDRVGRTYARLRHGLAEAEGCWGDDDLGEAFAKDFTPHAEQLLAGLRAMEESLRGTALQVTNAAADFETQDLGGAGRIGRAAEESPGAVPDYGTGTQPSSQLAPASAQGAENSAVPTDSAGADGTPSTQSPSGPAAAPQSTGTPGSSGMPGGSGAPDGSGEPSSPQNGQQDPSRAPERQGGAKSGADPSRPPRSASASPPAGVTPPATGRDAPRNAATAGREAAASARNSGVGARRETPWTGPPSRAARGSAAEQNPSSPRPGAPPRSPKEVERKRDRPRDAERSAGKAGASPLFAWLARTLADRHGVTVVGFDLPDLRETPVRQFAAAVDRVLTEYPAVELDVVAVAELDDEAGGVRWRSEAGDSAAVRSITLDRRVACDPDDQAVYAATVRELGLALNSAGGDVARRTAQRVLIVEYMRVAAGRYTTLAELLRGYRDWRAEIGGESGFDARRALGAAFAEVVLHRDRAGAPAKALHAALVGAAPAPG
ncbi:hypothetical protein [Nocardia wallacei]|uniref:hypothetical protein n=1 Tax=Nocardia wallacei TaxID=480035 RepID=UPI0024557EC8|nr:hypothetical protein [Nocardia wallacei]